MTSRNRTITLGLAVAQIVLAVIIGVVTATVLNPPGDCWLNLNPGSVCDFVYCTVGFSLLFSLILAVPTWLFHRQVRGKDHNSPLMLEACQLALFAAFWWMVLAITITARGKQASDAGYPEESARGATIAFSWIQMVVFLAAALVVLYDRYVHYVNRVRKDDDASSETASEANYVYTRALAHTPVQ